ncbi:unnamed protein product [Heterobilharzia americana]|nr:unnamed protein product [Heterobilharzia americana]
MDWEPETLTVSMPFYLEITLPKEMKRGEIIHIPISVFILDRKYLQTVEEKFTSIECYEISVNVQVNSSEWLIVSTSTYSDCLCSGDKKTFLVGLLPQRLGQLNITAESLAIRKGQSCKPIEHSETDQNALIFDLKTLKTKKLQSKVLTDKIRRQINVIPEGVQHETTISDILCLNEQVTESKREFQFILPKDLIKDSLHSYIAYSDEVLGPALVNLDNLVRLPTGCGEQNMVLVAPNVYILDYLKSTPSIDSNENKAKYIQTAKSHIVSGYIQQLKYRRDDGSFSAFGKSDKEGSTWLTAFVLRVFAKAYKLEPSLSIEWGNLFNDSIKFLISRQNNETGCFEEHGKVLYSPLQGITGTDQSEWKDILLTSYVSSALFETRPENVDNNHVKYTSEVEKSYDAALKCISQNLLSHDLLDEVPTSVIVQLTHMYTLIQPNSELTVNLLNQVIKRKQVTTDQFETKAYWTEMATSESNFTISNPTGSIDNNRPRDLESTAYAFLSLNKINQSVNELFPIIRWISSQQKSNGGFYSTQDTVLGIEAIAQFAKKLGISSSLPDQNISSNVLMISNSMDIGHFTLNDSITPQKRQVINQFELSNSHLKTDNQVIHSIWKLKSNQSQRDCMLVQNTFIYNLPEVEDNKTKLKLSFNIIQQTSPIDINCKSAKLVMCLRLNARTDEKPINTGMLLIRVAMVTGWEPIIEELNSQLGIEDDSLKMITINEQNEISLYFNEFSEDEVNTLGSWEKLKRCIDVPLHQVHYVENVKNATIIANEYYTPEESVTVTYRLNECRDAWDLPETPIPTEILPVTSTESTIITDNFSETTTFKMKTPCPVCIDKVTDIQSLADSIFTSVCNYSNGFYFIKVQENINSSSINATVTHISQSRYTASWNTTLQMPNFNECPCELITTNKYIVLFFDKDTYIDQGEPVINLEELNSAATLISSEELLPSLQIAEQRWSEIEKATLNGTTDTNFSFIYECRRLPKMVKFLKSKFLN